MAWEATYLLISVLLLPLASGNGLSPMNYVSPLYWANGPEMFRTLEGKTVSVECSYDPRYSSSGKIWCKKISEDICQPPVWSDSTGAEKLRFSIQHSSGFNSFTVTMTELKMSDSGTYHCGILGNSGNFISLRSIHLVVSKGLSDLPILTTTKYSSSHTAMTRSLLKPTAGLSSPDPGVSIINGTDTARSSISSVLVPMVCGLLSKALVFTVLFIVTQRSFG